MHEKVLSALLGNGHLNGPWTGSKTGSKLAVWWPTQKPWGFETLCVHDKSKHYITTQILRKFDLRIMKNDYSIILGPDPTLITKMLQSFSNDHRFSAKSSLQGISSNSLLWKRTNSSVVMQIWSWRTYGQHGCGMQTPSAKFYSSMRIRYIYLMSKRRGESNLDLCTTSVLAKKISDGFSRSGSGTCSGNTWGTRHVPCSLFPVPCSLKDSPPKFSFLW